MLKASTNHIEIDSSLLQSNATLFHQFKKIIYMIIIQVTEAELEQIIMKAMIKVLKGESSLTENPNQLLTRQEVAKKFDISLASLHNWVRDGLIPKPIHIARRVYFEQHVITEAIQKLRNNKI